jgi:plasmid stability protein
MTVELPAELEPALKMQASARGVSVEGFVREVVEQALAPLASETSKSPFKTSRGVLARYGQAPSAEEIDANRREMFRGFGQDIS